MMQIKVNNQFHRLQKRPQYPLSEALSTLIPDLPINGIAVALNGQVVPRTDWCETPVIDQDEILIITATQGG